MPVTILSLVMIRCQRLCIVGHEIATRRTLSSIHDEGVAMSGTSTAHMRQHAGENEQQTRKTLEGRVILVVGGTGPLGPGMLPVLTDAGATVITTAHRPIKDAPADAQIEIADVMHTPDVGPLVQRVLAQHTRIDAAVCIVGSITGGTFIQADHQTWREVIDLSVNSAVTTIREILPGMIERDFGRIVIVCARPPLDPTYSAAAAAATHDSVITLTRAFARDTRGTGVTANCILTDTVDTPEQREARPHHDPHDWVKPEQIGKVVTFLCSDAAGIVRGAALTVG